MRINQSTTAFTILTFPLPGITTAPMIRTRALKDTIHPLWNALHVTLTYATIWFVTDFTLASLLFYNRFTLWALVNHQLIYRLLLIRKDYLRASSPFTILGLSRRIPDFPRFLANRALIPSHIFNWLILLHKREYTKPTSHPSSSNVMRCTMTWQ
jgi:hypothetical protein